MKRLFTWQVVVGIILIALSGLTYFVHYLIFRDAHHIFLYLIGDVAFVFLEVLLVTMVLHGLLSHREKRAMLKKLNMVIGVFFSEVGTQLMKHLASFDHRSSEISKCLVVRSEWSDKEFSKVRKDVTGYPSAIDCKLGDLNGMKNLLSSRRDFLLALLENPNLLEHESFTNLLWAVFHLAEELASRKDLTRLSDPDYQHIAGDMKRAYALLLSEWLAYMSHLKSDYPYLFSLAMRTNPFDPGASVEIK